MHVQISYLVIVILLWVPLHRQLLNVTGKFCRHVVHVHKLFCGPRSPPRDTAMDMLSAFGGDALLADDSSWGKAVTMCRQTAQPAQQNCHKEGSLACNGHLLNFSLYFLSWCSCTTKTQSRHVLTAYKPRRADLLQTRYAMKAHMIFFGNSTLHKICVAAVVYCCEGDLRVLPASSWQSLYLYRTLEWQSIILSASQNQSQETLWQITEYNVFRKERWCC